MRMDSCGKNGPTPAQVTLIEDGTADAAVVGMDRHQHVTLFEDGTAAVGTD